MKLKEFEQQIIIGITLIDFYADWCVPCKLMLPFVDSLQEQYAINKNVKINKIDIDTSQEITQEFNIQSVPTFILFKDGQKMEQLNGIQSKGNLINLIDKYDKDNTK